MMFGVRSHGLIFGAIDNSYTIGAAVGPVLDGYIFDATGSYLFAFLASAAIAVCGLILSISLRPIITGTR
jgi:OFA family oxalate/formate antiporter-like MFS transporter